MNLIQKNKLFSFILLIVVGIVIYLDNTKVYNVYLNHGEPSSELLSNLNFQGNPLYTPILIINCLLTLTLGYSICKNALNQIQKNIIINFFASFSIGYLALLGILRIVTLFFDNNKVYFPTIIICGIIIYLNKNDSDKPKHTDSKQRLILKVPTIALISIFFIIFLAIQLYQGDFSWIGHGPGQYLFFIEDLRSLKSELKRFPIFSQHYDELLYTYFLTELGTFNIHPIISAWIVLALNKISVSLLIYLFFIKRGINKADSILGAIFIFFGTNSLVPTKFHMLFDSSNPLAFTVHSGRVVGIGILMFLYLIDEVRAQKFILNIGVALAAIGLTATPISNSLLIMFIISLLIITKDFKQEFLLRRVKNFDIFYPITIIFFIGLSYSKIGLKLGGLHLLPFLLAFILFLIIILHSYFKKFINTPLINREYFFKDTSKLYLIFIITTVVAMITTGNFLVNYLPFESVLNFLHEQSLFESLSLNKKFGYPMPEKVFYFIDARELGGWTQYSHGMIDFFICYGSYFIITIIGYSLIVLRSDRKIENQNNLPVIIVLLLSLLPILFLHMDFIRNIDRAWIKSRFIEIPLYFLLIFSLCEILKQNTKLLISITIRSLLVFYIITPMIFTGKLQQITNNLIVIYKLMSGYI